jgi:CRP/FNR family transcriptional regulator, nitrogen oxide reductase regulator
LRWRKDPRAAVGGLTLDACREQRDTMYSSVLLRSRVFDGLSDPERERWLARGTSSSLKRGDTLARQGEPARHFYLVESGFLKILQLTAEGTEVIVRFISPGEPFGGVVALGDSAYPVSAVVVQPSVVRAWTREAVGELLRENQQVRVNIMREMATHMTDALTRVRELTTARVGQRLAHTLLRLTRQCGQATEGGMLITQPLTRQELADLTGTTLYTVSRTLAKWESLGLIESRKRLLFVRSAKRLEEVAGSEED